VKTIEISSFTGVRNDISPERFKKNDLQSASNIELDETGKPFRRLGKTELDATASHSLWANDELAYIVRGGTLRQINPDLSITDLTIPILGERVAYTRIENDVFFTDNQIIGVVGTNGFRTCGILPPSNPSIDVGVGQLRGGSYLFTMTFVRNSGQESGASPVVSIPVGDDQSLELTNIPVSADPLVVTKNVYVSDWNGEVPYLIAVLDNTETTASISALPAGRTLAVRTLRMRPMPAGRVIGQYRGRLYVAENNYLWYSQPYEYELTHAAMNFFGFTSPIRTFNPVADGIYIGTDDDIAFLSGGEPESFVRKQVAPYGSVLGTEVVVPGYYFGEGKSPDPIQLTMSQEGLCACLPGGEFVNLTGDRYVLPEGVAKGASLLKLRGASPQLVTTLFS
jgi:hypothetical protein